MNRVKAKRAALGLFGMLGILLWAGCDGSTRKRTPLDGAASDDSAAVPGGANAEGYGGNGGAGATTGNGPDGKILGLGGSYSFGTREPWASVADTIADAGADAIADAGADAIASANAGTEAGVEAGGATTLGPSTVAEVCADYYPAWSAVIVPSESDCNVVANQYETLEYSPNNWSSCYMDGTPDQSCTMTKVTQLGGACGSPDNWRLTASSTAFFGGGFGFWNFAQNYSGWDGIGIWAKLEQGPAISFRLTVLDGSSEPVIDPTTGYPSCYYDSTSAGQDWDHDGVANLSPPPESLRCKGIWTVPIAIDSQWRFLMLPWSVWQASPGNLTSAIDPKTLNQLTVQFPPCSDFALQLGWVGAYRAKP
jgi:hypothetical protein